MRTTKNCTEKIQEARETHHSDHVEAAKDLRGAADMLEGRGEARGEEESVSDDTRPTHTNNYAHHQKLHGKNSGGTRIAPQ
jgi:hypothetical protein